MNDLELIKKALEGDENATKIYCGSYYLIQNKNTLSLFRFRGHQIPMGMSQIHFVDDECVADENGFLKMKYWSLPRWGF